MQHCGLTLDEAFLGVTYNAAKALMKGSSIGLIKENYNADMIFWNIDLIDELNEIKDKVDSITITDFY